VAEAIRVERTGPNALKVSGEIDLSTADRLADGLKEAESGEADVVLDASGLEFIDSSGIRELVKFAHGLGPERTLVIDSPTAAVRRVLEISGLGDLPQFEVRG